MILKECVAAPMDAATRADLIDLMARVLVAVFHEEGRRDNDRGLVQSQNQTGASGSQGDRLPSAIQRIRKVNTSSMRWPTGCVRWAGSRSRSSIVTWDRARALPPPSGKASSASSAW